MNLTRLAGMYAVAATVLAAALAVGLLAGPYRAIERSDYMTYHMAARIVLDGNGDCLYDAACQADAQRELIGEEPSFVGGSLPFTSPPWFASLVVPLGVVNLPVGFAIFTLLGLVLLAAAAWTLTPAIGIGRFLGPILLLTAWPTVMAAVRGQLTLPVVGLLGLSVAWGRYRSGVALGLAALKPTLVPLWAAWQLLAGHWRAVFAALAVLVGLVGISFIVVGPTGTIKYPGYLLGIAGPDVVGVHVDEMVNWRGAADRLGAGAALLVAGSLLTIAVVAYAWLRTDDRRLIAATSFVATPLVIPHANQHEVVLAAVGILLIVSAVVGPLRARLVAGAICTHLVLWAGPVLPAQASAWLLFMVQVAWLVVAVWLARQRGAGTSVTSPVRAGTD